MKVRQIIPATDWKAVFLNGKKALTTSPLVCFALTNDGEKSEIVGMIAEGTLITSCDGASFMGYIGPKEACDDLTLTANNKSLVEIRRATKNLASEMVEVRESAIELLGRFGPAASSATIALSKIVADEHETDWLRRLAVENIGYIGEDAQGAIPTLIDSLENDHLLEEVVRSLIGIGELGIKALIESASSNKNPRIRRKILSGFAGLEEDAPLVFDVVATSLNDCPEVAWYAMHAIKNFIEKSKYGDLPDYREELKGNIPQLVKLLGKEQEDIHQFLASETLGIFGKYAVDCIPALVTFQLRFAKEKAAHQRDPHSILDILEDVGEPPLEVLKKINGMRMKDRQFVMGLVEKRKK
jgi:hypothetical protein